MSGAPATESRRVVTVLFCDLVGSTELGRGLDAESLRAILSLYFERMRGAAERHGGRVEKFIGDAVMVVFGIPQAHEDDALRAVRAAAEMRAAIVELNDDLHRDHGITLATRIGVNTGEVVSGNQSPNQPLVTGDAVNLAARLEQSAGTNEILLGDDTFRLVRDAITSERAEPFEVKGFAEPIVAHRLHDVIPDQLGHARRFDSPMVDRESEQALLRRTFDRVVAGRRCQLFTILGPPGIGKSRLVEEFLAYCGETPTSLRGRCLPYGEGITFWPVAQIVEQAAALTGSDDRALVERKIASLLDNVDRGALIAQRVGQAVGISTGAPSPDETLWAIRRMFEVLARRRPLVIVFDDIHWGEPTFLDLIEQVADRSRDAPIMLLCLARPELLEVEPGWGGGKLNATTMLLDPLGSGDADELLRNLLGEADLPPGLRSRIVEMAGGYPLFVEEIVSELIEDQLITFSDDGWQLTTDIADLSLPATISGLLAARLDRLSQDERSVVERASLIGKDFSAVEVAAITAPEQRTDVGEQLVSLVRKELIRPAPSQLPGEDAFTFRHMLIRDAAYDGIPKSARADLHERYARWLEEEAGERLEEYEEIVAYHLDRARAYLLDVGPMNERVEDIGVRAGARFAAAGRRAAARGDTPATLKLLGRAAALMRPDDRERLAILPFLADGYVQAGELARAESLLDEMADTADRIGDDVLGARARLERYTWQLVTDPESTTGEKLQEVAQTAVRVAERDADDENLAAALEALVIAERTVTGDGGAMLDAAERALELAQKAGSRPVATTSASNVATALVLGATPCSIALERLEELDALFSGEPMAQAALGLEAALLLAMLDRSEEARRSLDDSRVVFEDLQQPRWTAEVAHTEGLITWWGGDLVGAEPVLRSAFEFFRDRGEAFDAALAAEDLSQLLCDLDRPEEADQLARGVVRDMPAYVLETQIAWRRVAARVRAGRGSIEEAERLAREAEAIAAGTDFLALHAGTLLDLAEVLTRTGRPTDAISAAEQALERSSLKEDVVGARRARLRLEMAAEDGR